MKLTATVYVIVMVLILSACYTISEERILLPADTPDSKIVGNTWRIEVKGKKVGKPLTLSYRDLLQLKTIGKKVLLICPMFFADFARWEGIPLSRILEMAEIDPTYHSITFTALDGFSRNFSKKETEENLLFLALNVNGEKLPLKHGYPVRLVAEDVFGGMWVKWIATIEIN